MSDPDPDREQRRRSVTEEPFTIAPEVLGRELATVRRRGVAILLDAILWFALSLPAILAMTILALHLQTPTLARNVTDLVSGEPVQDTARGYAELLALVQRRRPGAVPPRFAAALAEGDLREVEARLMENDPSIFHDPGANEPSYYDPTTDTLHLHRDVIFGPLDSAVSFGVLALLYFSLTAWIGRGRTPGKRLCGIRAVRLDGGPMRLRDAFDRAGGYAASLSTLGLGFLQARTDPNRQALHDRIAGTVVVRERGRT